LREGLEGIVLLLHHSWVGHEGIRLWVLLHVGERILPSHLLLLLHHHVGLELLLHVGRHHVHHLILLLHVGVLMMAHRVWNETGWLLLSRYLLLQWLLLAWYSVVHGKGIVAGSSTHVILLRLICLLSWCGIKVENIVEVVSATGSSL
jgi:hypothetical protein